MATSGKIATRCGGVWLATVYWVIPRYERPYTPTRAHREEKRSGSGDRQTQTHGRQNYRTSCRPAITALLVITPLNGLISQNFQETIREP
jgi:hypothetical protein